MSFDSEAGAVIPAFDPTIASFLGAATRVEYSVGSFAAATAAGANGSADGLYLGTTDENALVFSAPLTGSSAGVFADSARLVLLTFLDGVFVPDHLPSEPPELDALAPAAPFPPRGLVGTHFSFIGYVLVPPQDTDVIFSGPDDVPASFALDGAIQVIRAVPEPTPAGAVALLLALVALRRRG